ncbi:ABC transporter, ATP-binding protein [Gleimia coleocanis DSM 15436]|uniref:ABC transporter, ATP-binding protein n=1 Tax=Gleimia coleocanis DSM 15436 TaxID=525245 RepID=C0VYI5_9ACTO|nr:ABC transporter ATP-binding protein [Gleimia coleocanis]EEH64488.1 ABC transporter, ATP-binding protein [Gleimia coleocanis DSM 15436]
METQTPQAIASLSNVSKIYGNGTTQVIALNDVSVDFRAGEFTAIMGPSGSGKSTMLHTLAGLDSVTSGKISIDGKEITGLSDKDLTKFRRDHIGFIFQSFNLIPTLSAHDNIELPMRLAGRKIDAKWMASIVDSLQLTERLTHKPYQLSGGQQQRVAVARALVARPAILVADEPTGNLDSVTTAEVLNLLRSAVDQLKQTVIMVTHDRHAAAIADRVLIVKDGQIVADLDHPTADEIAQVA